MTRINLFYKKTQGGQKMNDSVLEFVNIIWLGDEAAFGT